MSNWMLSNPGKTVTIYNIPGFFKDVLSQSLSQSNILSGFRTTGIHPYNPNIFMDDDLLCSSVTDREITMEPQIIADVSLESPVSAEEETLQANLSEEPTPSTSMIILPEVIRPYPKSGPRKTIWRGRQPRKIKILIETPEKTDN
nr:unnamed protein product [Callosobruchus analis]